MSYINLSKKEKEEILNKHKTEIKKVTERKEEVKKGLQIPKKN